MRNGKKKKKPQTPEIAHLAIKPQYNFNMHIK